MPISLSAGPSRPFGLAKKTPSAFQSRLFYFGGHMQEVDSKKSAPAAYTVEPIAHGPHKGRWSWRIDVPPAFTMAKNAITPKQYQRHGIALNPVRATATATRQLRVHAKTILVLP